MKFVLLALIFSSGSYAETKKNLPVKDRPVRLEERPQLTGKAAEILKDDEDCEDKAKKVVEVVPEAVTLGTGGCTLE